MESSQIWILNRGLQRICLFVRIKIVLPNFRQVVLRRTVGTCWCSRLVQNVVIASLCSTAVRLIEIRVLFTLIGRNLTHKVLSALSLVWFRHAMWLVEILGRLMEVLLVLVLVRIYVSVVYLPVEIPAHICRLSIMTSQWTTLHDSIVKTGVAFRNRFDRVKLLAMVDCGHLLLG